MSHIEVAAPTTAAKAIAGTIVAGLLAFLAPIGVTMHAGLPVTGITWFDAGVAALVFASIVYPTIYATPNKTLV